MKNNWIEHIEAFFRLCSKYNKIARSFVQIIFNFFGFDCCLFVVFVPFFFQCEREFYVRYVVYIFFVQLVIFSLDEEQTYPMYTSLKVLQFRFFFGCYVAHGVYIHLEALNKRLSHTKALVFRFSFAVLVLLSSEYDQ